MTGHSGVLQGNPTLNGRTGKLEERGIWEENGGTGSNAKGRIKEEKDARVAK